MIKYIAKEHHAEISKREIREAHKDHPEFSELLGELYEAFHELMINKGNATSSPVSPSSAIKIKKRKRSISVIL